MHRTRLIENVAGKHLITKVRHMAMLAFIACALLIGLWLTMGGAYARADDDAGGDDDAPNPVLANGVAAGDVTTTSAVIWTRSVFSLPVALEVTNLEVTNLDDGRRIDVADPTLVTFITRTLDSLSPGGRYVYTMTNTVRVISGTEVLTATTPPVRGEFRTPAAAGHRGLRFGVAGDWRGELSPYPAITNAPDRALDFFVELGDTIYADVPSPALPLNQAISLDDFRAKHAEVYGERHGLNAWADLRSSTAIFAMVDDHEVMNDFAGGADVATDGRFTDTSGLINQSLLFGNGMQAFHEFNPLRAEFYADVGDTRMNGRRKLYRYRTFGKDAALLLVDSRAFRDEMLTPIDPNNQLDILRFLNEAYLPGRTMLGTGQLAQLKVNLLDAHQRGVTWKFVVVPEPIQNLGPAGGEDRFEGYAAERADLLSFITSQEISNVVFIAADVHGTIVNNLTYQTQFGLTIPQTPTDIFEVTTGPVAYDAPFGPTVIELAFALGLISAEDKALYDSLPVASDPDDVVDDKDDFVKAYMNLAFAQIGYDPVGLAGSSLNAQLVAGDYINAHTFGWTEFEIAADSQRLTVTTYGIAPYGVDDLAADPAAVLARAPAIISQFFITPTLDVADPAIYLPLILGQ